MLKVGSRVFVHEGGSVHAGKFGTVRRLTDASAFVEFQQHDLDKRVKKDFLTVVNNPAGLLGLYKVGWKLVGKDNNGYNLTGPGSVVKIVNITPDNCCDVELDGEIYPVRRSAFDPIQANNLLETARMLRILAPAEEKAKPKAGGVKLNNGDKVRIAEDSQFYRDGDPLNPKGMDGVIKGKAKGKFEVGVKWANGIENVYNERDLVGV